MSRILNDDIQDIAVEAGSLILENGGETYRSEDTIVHVAESLGAKEVHSFVTPTVVIFSWRNADGRHFMNMKRIVHRGTNLKKIALVNSLSRDLEWSGRSEDPTNLRKKLKNIREQKDYPAWFIICAAAISSFFYTRMFGGGNIDGCYAFIIGILLRIVMMILDKIQLNGFIVTLLAGFLVSSGTGLLSLLLPFEIKSDIVVIGTMMQVVPGLAMVNAIRDIIAGDLLAGSARVWEALMIAVGLSIGAVGGTLLLRCL
ncbi:MAG: threonine/serine exporter family protein [Treponema sp.]|nr:threonine/serine exporter family protein [Treponema sp.]